MTDPTQGTATLLPGYIDPEHTGRDRELLEAFYLACLAEGGSTDEINLRGIHAAIAADRAARGGVALQAFIESQRPLDPEVARVLTPETLWDMYQESPDRAARPQSTPEALQAAYTAWFKAEQGIPPSPAAARTAAAFALAVLRGEVEL